MMSTSIHPERGSAILDASRTANASPAFPRDTDKTRIRPVRVLRGSDLDVGRLASLGSILILMIVGGIPRLADLDRLPLRIDEVYTLLYLRQSWSAVLGLGGYYDFHPPLFFAMGKAAAVVVPEEIASRSVAALAGLLTIPLFYALVKHVLDRVAALIATLVLAIAPVHIEASRDGRMYATTIFFVLLSYYALVMFIDSPRFHWIALYSVSVAVALYVDYSAAYAFVPQASLFVVALLRRRQPRNWLLLFAGPVVALLAYAPWLPEIVDSVGAMKDLGSSGFPRDEYLAASWSNIGNSIPYVLGVSGRGSAPAAYQHIWQRWHLVGFAVVIVMLVAGLIGLIAMLRRRVAVLVAASLCIGVPLTAIAFSQVSAGYASRTVQIALLGWGMAFGWLVSRLWNRGAVASRAAAVVLVIMVTGVSLSTLPATLSHTGQNYQFEQVANLLNAYDSADYPVIVLSNAGMLTDVLTMYGGESLESRRIITVTDGVREHWMGAERWLDRGPTRQQVKEGALVGLLPPDDPSVDAVWYVSRQGESTVGKALSKLGYQRLFKRSFIGVDMWLWARPGAPLGEGIEQDAGPGTSLAADGWTVQGDTEWIDNPEDGQSRLKFAAGYGTASLTRQIPSRSAGIYALSVDATGKKPVEVTARLACVDAEGQQRAESSQASGFSTKGRRSTLLVGVLCPDGTRTVLAEIGRAGTGELIIDDAVLTYLGPRQKPPES